MSENGHREAITILAIVITLTSVMVLKEIHQVDFKPRNSITSVL